MTTPAARQSTLPLRLLRGAAIVAICGWVGGLLGKLHWTLELFSHFLPFYAAALLLATLLCVRPRRQRALFALVLLLQVVQLAALYLPLTTAARLPSDRTLKAISFNLFLHNASTPQATQWLSQQNADLIFLTEVTPIMQPALEGLQRSHPWRCVELDDSPFGLALYSRQPLAYCAVSRGTETPYPWIMAILDDGTTVYGLHPPPPLGPTLAAQRNHYLRTLASEIGRQERAIILGDLNMTPWSPEFGKFLQHTGTENGRRGMGLLPSWTALAWLPPLLPLDHVLVKGAHIDSLQRGPTLGSDHAPLLASIRWSLTPQGGGAARYDGILHPVAR